MSYGVGLRNGVAFALGTIPSLTSGGGLRPSLLLDFLSGSLDPRITFSRGTQAMQYGSDGTLQYAPNNLLTYSNQADNAAWTKSNSFVQTNLLLQSQTFDNPSWSKSLATATADVAIAPDGTLTADKLAETAATGLHENYQAFSASAITYTASVYFKAAERTEGALYITTAGLTAGAKAVADLSAGTVAVTNFGATTGSTATITPIPNYPGWYRVTLTVLATVTTYYVDLLTSVSGSQSYLGTAGYGIYAWGAQLVQGSVPGDYRATTSAALPVLYADYNGALRARKLCETTTTSVHLAQNNQATVGNTQTISVYAKAGERTQLYLQVGTNGGYFNLATGVVVSGTNASITPVADGWYRCALGGFPVVTNGNCFVGAAVGGANSYAGDGSSGIYIADAQLAAGYLPLAVTETTSAAVYGPRFDYDPSSLVTQNLLTYSQQFDNAAWTKITATVATGVTDPNGGLTAATVTANAAFSSIRQVLGASDAAIRVNSIWLRRRTGTGNINFWAPGVVTPLVISTLPSVWTRYSISDATAQTTRTLLVELVANGDAIDIAFAQMNTGSTALSYTATTTAPYTLTTARGLLIEEQRANLFTYSNDFTNVIWSNVNVTVTPASTTSPEGVVNASKLAATAGAATTLYQQAAVASTAATGSIYVKQGTGATTANYFGLRNITTALDLVTGTLNYSTGAFTYTVGSAGVVVTNVGNGWWRISVTATAGITSGNTIRLYIGYSGGAQTAGDFLYAYGAQLEAGACVTSYFPTVGSTATRNADSASITTLTPWFNAAAGTLYSQIDTNASAAPKLFSRLGPTISGSIGPYATSTSVILDKNGTGSLITTAGTLVVSNTKTAWAYDGTNVAMSVNGGAVATAAGALGTPADALYIGRDSSAVTNLLNGHIQSLRYYPIRLPNASLQSITV